MCQKLILAICLAASIAGCSMSIVTGDASVGGYSYNVHGRSGDATGHAAEISILQDRLFVEMEEGVLTVNDESYGQIAPGSTIEVDGSRVIVNEVVLQAIGRK